ncbi:O-antigen ligase family protein [Paenibacillus lutimineralis]|uniref:O-antigen ligase family protein n=1 Tax=Paenibacillus lutimineralis TaxID=2707005 RepID=UPI0013A680C0|nr:O-antigen ligase family protein [Paenibacillus lutimineralis]
MWRRISEQVRDKTSFGLWWDAFIILTKPLGAVGGLGGLVWITIMAICLNSGMFFTDSISSLVLMGLWFVCAFLLVVGYLVKGIIGSLHNEKIMFPLPNLSPTQRTPYLYVWICSAPFVIAGIYSLHLVMSSVRLSAYATMISALEWLFYALLGLAMFRLGMGDRERGRKLIQHGLSWTSSLLSLSAVGSILGIVSMPYAILRTGDSEVSLTGARLGGLLQYPNTFGAVAAALLLERLLLLVHRPSSDFKRSAGWKGQQGGAQVLLLLLCLLLTESRGAYIAGAVGWAAGWLLLRGAERSRFVRHSGVFLAAAALLARQLSAAQLAPSPLPGLLLLAAVMAAALALSGRVHRGGRAHGAAAARGSSGPLVAAWGAGKSAYIKGLALSLTGLGLLLALAPLLTRGLRIATLSARWDMYADAWKLFQRSPWIGRGGDTWRLSFRSIQSRPYVGAEVHSGFIDIALDLGLVGLMVVLLWLGAIAWQMLRLHRVRSSLFPSLIVLCLHSLIDFDMSYGLYWVLILMFAVVALVPTVSSPESPIPSKSCSRGASTVNSAVMPEMVAIVPDRTITMAASTVRFAATGLLAAVLLAASVAGLHLVASQLLLARAEATAGTEQPLLLQRSLAASPSNTAARLALAAHSLPQKSFTLLQQGLRYERENPELLAALGTVAAQQGDLSALTAFQRAAALDRFNGAAQTNMLQQAYHLARWLKATGKEDEARIAAEAGVRLYCNYSRLSDLIVQHPSWRNDRKFRLTLEARVRGRQLYAFKYAH